jgi:hypothetical protein
MLATLRPNCSEVLHCFVRNMIDGRNRLTRARCNARPLSFWSGSRRGRALFADVMVAWQSEQPVTDVCRFRRGKHQIPLTTRRMKSAHD